MENTTDNKLHLAKFEKVVKIAEDTYEMNFVLEKPMDYQAGQYVWVQIPEMKYQDPKGDRRAMSLTSIPSQGSEISILFRKSLSGFIKSALKLKKGDEVNILGPHGQSFGLPGNSKTPLVMISGGVGIAPFLSITRQAVKDQLENKLTLININTTKIKALYNDEVKALHKQNSNINWLQKIGKLEWADIKSIANLKEAMIYIAGPQGFIDYIHELLTKNDVFEHQLRFESLYPMTPEIEKFRSYFDKNTMSKDVHTDLRSSILLNAIESSTHHTIITDTNGVIVFANRSAQSITGYKFSEMQGNTPRLWGGLMPTEFNDMVWKNIRNGKNIDGELVNRRKNHNLYTVMAHISPIKNNAGEVVGWIGSEEDITPLKESEQRFRAVTESANEAIVSADSSGNIISWNAGAEKIFGYVASEVIGKPMTTIMPAKYHEQHRAGMARVQAGGEKHVIGKLDEVELVGMRKDGSEFPVELSLAEWQVANNNYYTGIMRDITDRKQAEQAVAEAKTKDEAILESIGDGMITIDKEGKTLLVNSAAERMLGFKKDELIGKKLYEILHSKDDAGNMIDLNKRPLAKALSTGKKFSTTATNNLTYYVRKDGTQFPVSITANPVIIDGVTVGVIDIFRDITHEVAVSATGPITLSALGDIGCTTCVVSGGSLFTLAGTSGANSAISQGGTATIAAGDGITTTSNGSGTVTVARTAGGSAGDVQYWNGATWTNLGVGAVGEVLTVSGGSLPSWAPTGAVGDPLIGNEVTDAVASGGLERSGAGTVPSPYKLGVDVNTTGTTLTTSSNSGLETAADGLSLLRGCADQRVLVWTSGSSDWSCQPYVTGGGGTITSINSQVGPAVTINNATGAGNAITIDDATTAAKGIASFNSSNFDVAAGAVNLKDTAVVAGSYAGANNANGSLNIPNFTVDAKGRLTAAGTSSVTLTGIPNSSLANSTIGLATGTTGSDVNVSGSPAALGGTITLNIPDASTTARGLVTTGTQTFGGDKTINDALAVNGNTTLNGNSVTIGNATSDRLTVNSQLLNFSGTSALAFQGTTDNAFVTNLTLTDPTATRNINLPNASGTVAVSATGPITLSALGDIGCSTCLTSAGNGDIVNGTGMSSTGTLTNRLIGAGNVTFTLADTAVTAASYGSASSVATFTVDAQGRLTLAGNTAIAINASQITAGTLPIARGGTNTTTVGTAGSIAYSNGTSYQFSAAGTSGQVLTSGGAGVPTWTSLSGITVSSATGTANQVLVNGTSGAAQTGAITLTTPQDIATTSNVTFNNITAGGDVAVNGGDLTSSAVSFNLLNSGVTTLNIGGAATTFNYGPGGASATTLNFAGGSGATGCTIDGATGNLTCSGAIATTATSGTQGWWSRSGTILSPTTAGDNVTTSGNISTTGTGTITAAGLLTGNAGITTSGGAFSLSGTATSSLSTSAGVAININTGTSGTLTLDSGTTGNVNLGTGANAKTVTVGNNTGATAVNINSGTGNINLQPGGTGTTANVQIGAGGAGSTTPDLLVLDRKSNAGDPTGTNGAMYYNASTNKFRCYENSAWVDCINTGSSKARVKSANETVTSSTTFQNDDELSFSIGASERWAYFMYLQGNVNATPDIKFQVTAPAGATCNISFSNQVSAADTVLSNQACSSSSGNMGSGNTDSYWTVAGYTTTGVTSGTVNLQWAQNSSSGSATTVNAGSYLLAFKETGADLAEVYYTKDNEVVPATIVSVDPSLKAGVKMSSQPYQNDLMGVISTKPGQILSDSSDQTPGSRPVNLAMAGRVPVRVTSEGGSIKPGDMITSSSKPGVGMKANSSGGVVGRALTEYDASSGQDGVVVVFIEKGFNQAAIEADFEGLLSSNAVDVAYVDESSNLTSDISQAGVNVSGKKYSAFNQEFVDNLMNALKNQQTQIDDVKTRVAKLESGGGTSVDVLKTLAEANAVTLNGDLSVNGNVVIAGKLSVGKDTAGEKSIPAGQNATTVLFTTPYNKKPIVNATAQDFVNGGYRVTNISATGFTIEMQSVQNQDVRYSWNALAQ